MTGADGDTAPRVAAAAGPPPVLPTVSVVVPARDEAHTVGALLDALWRQTYPPDLMEVIVADGGSADGTRAAVERAALAGGRAVRVVENPARTVPAGINRGVAVAGGRVVLRVDAHSVPAPDYVERCVENLVAGRGESVGGVIDVLPGADRATARAIAVAVRHPFGAGDAAYRTGGAGGAVDTVPFGAFWRSTLERVGPFDEGLPVNQDYEMNARIRAGGGTVWLDPSIRCAYLARPTLRRLARQYGRYGFYKRRMLRRHPSSLRWRQAVPAAFTATVTALAAAAPVSRKASRALTAVGVAYGLAAGTAAVSAARAAGDVRLAPRVAAAFATVHLSWGAGFLLSALRPERRAP